MDEDGHRQIKRERWRLLLLLEKFLDGPMIFLGFVWLVLLIIELTEGLSPALEKTSIVIWIVFIVDFLISLILAPDKTLFLKKNVLTAVSLIIPALRIFRLLRFIRLLRGLRLVKVLGSVNRSMKSLTASMNRRGFAYMLLLTTLVILAGSAGMYAFENEIEGGLKNYGEALWFTAMVVITVGTEYWPRTTEGRILCFILALYGFAVLGYITATLATFFIGKDVEKTGAPPSGSLKLKEDIAEIKDMIRNLKNKATPDP